MPLSFIEIMIACGFKAILQQTSLLSENLIALFNMLLNAMTGPAYVFALVEALAEAGESLGLPADLAMRLARATIEGAGELLYRQPDVTAAKLRENVTSPGGTTAAALAILRAPDGYPALLAKAATAARDRARELRDNRQFPFSPAAHGCPEKRNWLQGDLPFQPQIVMAGRVLAITRMGRAAGRNSPVSCARHGPRTATPRAAGRDARRLLRPPRRSAPSAAGSAPTTARGLYRRRLARSAALSPAR